MKSFKLITLLFLGFLIFGSAGYFAYQLFIKPGRAEKRDKAAEAAAPAPTPTPDPGIPQFQRLKALQDSGKTAEAREGWKAWMEANPKSPLQGEAKSRLGAANMLLLFQSSPQGGVAPISYTVVKGDSLARIASKHQSNAELIQRANELPNINLQIGQQLVIPQLKISVELDRAARTLTLLDNGTFLKEYTLLSAPAAPKNPAPVNSKVLDKSAISGTKRVAFGDKAYPQSERCILIVQSPAIVAAPAPSLAASPSGSNQTNAPTQAQPTPPVMPGGYVLSSQDLLEIFPLVSRNTPVVIH